MKNQEKQVTVFTNGNSLFTLENFSQSAGVCHIHNITIHKTVSKNMAMAMHERGQLHYVFGIGDRKVLTGYLNRKMNLKSFIIS